MKQKINYLILRKSPFFIFARLILVEVIYLTIIIGGILGNLFLSDQVITFNAMIPIAILTLFKIVGIFLICLAWVNEFYEIRDSELIHYKGVVSKHRKAVSTGEVRSITVKQDFIGMIFRFGTIILYNPAAKESIILSRINNPKRSQQIISQFLPKIKEPPVAIVS